MSGALGAFPVMATRVQSGLPSSPAIFAAARRGRSCVRSTMARAGKRAAWTIQMWSLPVWSPRLRPMQKASFWLALRMTASIAARRGGRYWETANFGLYDLRVWSLSISPALAGGPDSICGRGRRSVPLDDRRTRVADGRDRRAGRDPAAGGCDFARLRRGRDSLSWHCGRGRVVLAQRGKEWQPAGGSEGTSINCLAFSPGRAREGTVYAGTTEHGILVSGDCGRSWQSLSADEMAAVWCLAETDCGAGRVLLPGSRVRAWSGSCIDGRTLKSEKLSLGKYGGTTRLRYTQKQNDFLAARRKQLWQPHNSTTST